MSITWEAAFRVLSNKGHFSSSHISSHFEPKSCLDPLWGSFPLRRQQLPSFFSSVSHKSEKCVLNEPSVEKAVLCSTESPTAARQMWRRWRWCFLGLISLQGKVMPHFLISTFFAEGVFLRAFSNSALFLQDGQI